MSKNKSQNRPAAIPPSTEPSASAMAPASVEAFPEMAPETPPEAPEEPEAPIEPTGPKLGPTGFPPPPSLDEVVAAGFTLRIAHGIVAEETAKFEGQSPDDARQVYDAALAIYDEIHAMPKGDALALAEAAQAPASPPVAEPAPAGSKRWFLEVRTVRAGRFCRAKNYFGTVPVRIPFDDLTADQIAAIEAENKINLFVKRVQA